MCVYVHVCMHVCEHVHVHACMWWRDTNGLGAGIALPLSVIRTWGGSGDSTRSTSLLSSRVSLYPSARRNLWFVTWRRSPKLWGRGRGGGSRGGGGIKVASQGWLLRLIWCHSLVLRGRFPYGLVFLQRSFETMFILISDLVHQQLDFCIARV